MLTNNKRGLTDLDIMEILKILILFSLVFVIFLMFNSLNKINGECEKKCEKYKPTDEVLIEAHIPSLKDYCECKYSESERRFML
jgi:uncharacterized membrane protein